MRVVLIIVLVWLCVSCRHKEPKPSKSVYDQAVVSVEPRPERLLVTPTAKIPTPSTQDSHKTKKNAIVTSSPLAMLCESHLGTVADVGPVVARLTDKARAASLDVMMESGVAMKGIPGRWRVCLPVKQSTDITVTEPATRVAQLHHTGSYTKLVARRGELEAWLRTEGASFVQGAPMTLTLFDDPEQNALSKLRSTLSIPVMGKQ